MTIQELETGTTKEFRQDRRTLIEILRLGTDTGTTEAFLSDRAAGAVDYVNHYSSLDAYPLSYFVDESGEFLLEDFAKGLEALCHKARPEMDQRCTALAIKASMRHYMGEDGDRVTDSGEVRRVSGDKVAKWRLDHNEDVIARAASLTVLGFLTDAVPVKPHSQHEARLDEMIQDSKGRIENAVLNSLESGQERTGFVYLFLPEEYPLSTGEGDSENSVKETEEAQIDFVAEPHMEQKEFLFRMGLVNADDPEKVELPEHGQEFTINHLGFPGYSIYCRIIGGADSGTCLYQYDVDVSTPYGE